MARLGIEPWTSDMSQVPYQLCYAAQGELLLTLLHSERPKLYAILAFLSAIGLRERTCSIEREHILSFQHSFLGQGITYKGSKCVKVFPLKKCHPNHGNVLVQLKKADLLYKHFDFFSRKTRLTACFAQYYSQTFHEASLLNISVDWKNK